MVTQEQIDGLKKNLGRDYMRKLIDEMEMLIGTELDPVTGIFVIVQRDSGRIYPHIAGDVDAVRALGMSHTYLSEEAAKQFRAWVANAADRRTLEGGF